MANPKSPSTPRVARPRPRSDMPRQGASAPRGGAAAVAAPSMSWADENLGETYAHVRRDLRRIILLAILLLAGIYGSQYL
jgi:hypothetical protein